MRHLKEIKTRKYSMSHKAIFLQSVAAFRDTNIDTRRGDNSSHISTNLIQLEKTYNAKLYGKIIMDKV
jgi:hypothetical protein